MFSLITGFIEKGESPEQAILRETNEELGVSTERLEFIGHYSFPKFNQLLIAFSVQAYGEVHPSDEIAEIKLLSKSELERFDFGRLDLTAKIVADWLRSNQSFPRTLRDQPV
jgi:NADH pyrophosphatase NudC (nudix superfamily)